MVSRTPLVLCALALMFGLLYSVYNFGSQRIFQSPDEQAAYVFARHFAQEGDLRLVRPVESTVVLPRSVTVVDGYDVPGGFIGLPLLLGNVWRLFGETFTIIFASLLAALAPVGCYFLYLRFWPKAIANQAAFLAWFMAPFAYFAARAFLPNAIFVSCLFLSFGLLVRPASPTQRAAATWLYPLCSGLFLGLALAIRPVELIWVGPVALGLLLLSKWRWPQILAFSVACAWPLGYLAYWQEQTYGGWFATGYTPIQGGEDAATAASVLFPFGIHLWQALTTFVRYQIFLFWWQLPMLVAGLGFALQKSFKSGEYKKYTVGFLAVSLYLIVYYGSWSISDHPDPNWVGLGVAYNRYWLPLTLASLPFIVLGIQRLAVWIRRPAASVMITAFLVLASVCTTVAWGSDNLWAMHNNGVEYGNELLRLQAVLPAGSVIINSREDKWLWPSFAVIRYSEGDFRFIANLPPVLAKNHHQLYWLTTLPASHMADIEQRFLAPAGLTIEPVPLSGDYSLYRLKTLSHE